MENKEHILNRVITSILALVVVAGVFMLLYFIMFRENAGVEKDLIIFVLGAVTGWVSIILSYYFGSSKGSKEKTDLLNKQKDEQTDKKS